jgi:nucleoside-diphosphate-sugar epimerase
VKLVAITGAAGFIGQHLCARLATVASRVQPVVRSDFSLSAGPEHLERLFSGADVVIHAAGATRAPTHRQLRDSTVELTRRVVDAATRAGAGRIVFISSQAAAGPASARDRPVTEDMRPAPVEPYGRFKLDAEGVVRGAPGLPFVIVRPASVYGPGDQDFLNLFRLARRRIAIHPANRAQWISVIAARDLVDGVTAAATSQAAVGETFFLCNDEPVQWSGLFKAAARSAGTTLALDVELPRMVVDAGAAIGDLAAWSSGRAGLLTTNKVALSRPPYWICSNARARRVVGFAPQVTLQAGFEETYRWYRNHGWL